MERVTARVPEKDMEDLNRFVEVGEFPSISESIRYAVNDLIDSRVKKVLRKLTYQKTV